MNSELNYQACQPEETANLAASPTFVRPRYTTRKRDGAWEVQIVVPGVAKSDVEIAFEEDRLNITAHRDVSLPEAWRAVSVSSRPCDGYELSLGINFDVDRSSVTANLKNGVLTLNLPLSEASKPRLSPVG